LNTQKVAITIPKELIMLIDAISKEQGISRSKYISSVLREKVMQERDRNLQKAYDVVFSDDSVKREQLETAKWFDALEIEEGTEW
jgi:metal-responsive CopG/Arc/MetJ family transcriptional regulator